MADCKASDRPILAAKLSASSVMMKIRVISMPSVDSSESLMTTFWYIYIICINSRVVSSIESNHTLQTLHHRRNFAKVGSKSPGIHSDDWALVQHLPEAIQPSNHPTHAASKFKKCQPFVSPFQGKIGSWSEAIHSERIRLFHSVTPAIFYCHQVWPGNIVISKLSSCSVGLTNLAKEKDSMGILLHSNFGLSNALTAM